jgi:SAM-dependent methyltransferase
VALLQALFKANYTRLDAFDYAPASIAYCQEQVAGTPLAATVNLAVADATQLVNYDDASMMAVLDKGTLDAIFLAGSTLEERQRTLCAAVCELQRVLQPSSGIFWSLSGICTEALRDLDVWEGWAVCADSTVDLVSTEDGYTSNNLDGDLLVWRKPPTIAGH